VKHTVRSDAGFTLVDMIVVMVLFATLSAMAIPVMQDFNGAIVLGSAQPA
jgi:prepilin-type N-terminal cleavage/methylation domain-containing protein